MPFAAVSSGGGAATSRERRVGSGSSRSVSVGGRRGKSGSTATKSSTTTSSSSSSASHPPPILRTSSPSSPPVKGILVNNSSSDHHHHNEQDTTEQHHEEDNATNTTASSYLKPLLKYLPRHIDPSTIARLLKNVHPSAFGSYRTKEAWRREHPQVLDAAYSLQEHGMHGERDTDSTLAVIRPSISSSDEVCLAHSPPSATFSSSEDDGEGDFDEDYISYGLNQRVGEDDDEFDRKEAKELEDYFNDEFDADLGTSPESASSLRDLHQNHHHQNPHAHPLSSNGNTSSNSTSTSSSRRTSTTRRVRSNSQDSTTTSATAKNDTNPSASSAYLEEAATASLTSPRSPLAIYLSKPDEEQDSPLAGPSQRVLDAYYNNHNDDDSSSSVLDESNDSGATITFSNLHSHSPLHSHHSHHTHSSHQSSAEDHYHHCQAIASTSAAILYPDFKRPDSVESSPKTPPSPSASGSPSPSSSSLPPSPSSLSPSSHYTILAHNNNARRSPSATSSSTRSQSYSVTDPYEKSRSPSQEQQQQTQPQSQHYPILPNNIPRIIRRQTSSSSLASSSRSTCTCRSTNSAISNASVSSRSSSIKFAPLPEEEIAIARRESRNRNGGGNRGNDKSRVMGVKGRRNLLLGIGVDNDGSKNDDGSPGGPSNAGRHAAASPSYTTGRSSLDESEEETSIAEDSDEDDDDDDDFRSRTRRIASKDQFDALAYFGEEDLLNPPPPALSHRGKNSATALKTNGDQKTPLDDDVKVKKNRKDSDVTIRLGKNGELIERRPLGVTLEELTLPMKRVKETRGRSRQTNDLSASFTSPKLLSPPLSPSHSSTTTSPRNTFGPPLSPTRASNASTRDEAMSIQIENGLTSPDASHEKTPMPTPRLEKKRPDMFTSVTPVSPPSSRSTLQTAGSSNKGLAISSPTSTPLRLPLSPAASQPDYSTSSTSPTHSLHSNNGPSTSSNGGSNEITPMPTPRAGSPIAGLKMTTSIFEERGQAQSKGFKLVDTFATSKTSGSRSSTCADDDAADEGKEGEFKVSTVANILALGGLLDDTLSTSDLTTAVAQESPKAQLESIPPSRETEAKEQELQNSSSDNDDAPAEEVVSEDDSTSEDGDESGFNDHDKTPTLHASLDLTKLNETTHALHARYRKKRSVGIPHGVTAKKKLVTSSRKIKKT